MRRLLLVFPVLLITACQSEPRALTVSSVQQVDNSIVVNERTASPAGRKVLAIGRDLALVKKEVVKGGCWDFINRVYNDAGFPNSPKQRVVMHDGTKERGPYATVEQIQAGDWLYYINHSYRGVEHSGIFVGWEDKERKLATILSYAGEHRNEPGRYRAYDLSNVYRIIRPLEL